MVFLAGPRQVGKTTCSQYLQSKETPSFYFNWDERTHQRLLLMGSTTVADHIGLNKLTEQKPLIIFDEIHKYSKWKSWLKGFFDVYGGNCRIIVTGSAKLNVYKKGSDSLMGHYLL